MELNDVLRRIKIAGGIFLGVLLIGVLGYGWLSNGQWFDAFYMTAITISTIGFHEVIKLDDSYSGRLFTIFIAFSGIGVLTYLFSNLAALFVEGDIRKTFYKRNMINKIKKLEGHYIICGCGRVGRNIALELYKTNRPFVLTDISDKVLENFLPQVPDSVFIAGDSTDDGFLDILGVKKAAGIFANASDDNTNLVICITARQLNPNIKIITRINDMNHARKMRRAGADKIVSPTFIGGQRMASEMVRPAVSSFMDDMSGNSEFNLRMEEIGISDKLDGQTLEDFPMAGCEHTIILALKDGDKWIYNPKGGHKLRKGNWIILMTTPKERKIIEQRLL
ncbi:TrkA family potassium uptake protein [Marinoscillum sp. MHG1-6]|uniref:potassium channel family protein n=1 Tax=Marinoscillum sp. MHG1-6 TaxID=2959627 RepID=UPI0021579462|nr:potassium channel protein [Marinoscillum sp. MHG1-6]